jgi:hypothetical protein
VTNDSEKNVEDFLTQVAGRFFRAFSLLDRRDALNRSKLRAAIMSVSEISIIQKKKKSAPNATHSNKVHLVGTPEGRAHVESPADPEGKEDGDVDVRREEVLRVPHEKDLVSVDEDEDRRPEDTPYGQTRLQRIPVRELGTVEALYSVTTPCRNSVRMRQKFLLKGVQNWM